MKNLKNLKKVIVSSTNPVKISAVQESFESMLPEEVFDFIGVSVESGVPDQPMGEEETYQGALNRAENAYTAEPAADYWVGLEGGCEIMHDDLACYAWMVIRGKSDGNTCRIGKARSGTFFLPEKVRELVSQGMELGKADDIVFNRSNSKQSNGSVGILTDDAITRHMFYVETLKLALIPFLKVNENHY